MEYTRKRKAVIIGVLALVAFGASQYVAATGIAVNVVGSELVSEDSMGSTYELLVAVKNPTVFPLIVGYTQFDVSDGVNTVGAGAIDSFVMPVMGDTVVDGMYRVDSSVSQEGSHVRISGTTVYHLLVGNIAVPFEYDSKDGFIHGI